MATYDIRGNQDGRWTIADFEACEHVPVIELVQYQQNQSAICQALGYWQNFAEKIGSGSPYDNLYNAQPTGVIYYLPYLVRYHHAPSQTWSPGAGPGYNNNVAVRYALIAEQFRSPAAGVEQPHAWAGQNLAEYTISFPLINTFNPDEDIDKNMLFLRSIISAGLLGRPDPIRYVPPRLYTVNIPGIRYSPAATIQTTSVTNMGSMHYHELGGEKFNIPDAWAVELKIKELILESREIYQVAVRKAAASTVTAGLVSPDGVDNFW